VPIFTGGATESKVRQARHLWDAAKSGVEYTVRQTQEQTRDSYQGVISQIAQVRALRQAVESNRVSLQSAQAGYDVGTRTVLDVLTARDALLQAETNYALAKYGYLNDIVSLRLAAGNLDRGFIEQINSWLAD
jgi:outer membrane protein